MHLVQEELEKIRLHVGIHTGYQRFEKHAAVGLLASKRNRGELKPLPEYKEEIKAAYAAYQYLTAPLLHDLNRIRLLLDIWEEHLPCVLSCELKARIREMENGLMEGGGQP